MTKEITKTQTTLPSTKSEFVDYEINQEDIVIPKILLMQPISDMVSQDKAKYGDFVDSLSKTVIGDGTKGIKFIPLSYKKIHIINSKGADGKFKFTRIEPILNAVDDAKPYQDIENGVIIERKKIMEFFVFCPDLSDLPMALQFKGMSIKAGKNLYTAAFVMAKMAKKMPYETTFLLTADKTKNDKGNFAILNSRVIERTTQENLVRAKAWYQTANSSNAIVTETEEEVQSEMAF